eukprot:11842332-Ditylum_brightwellii.AAC.1
MHRGNSTSGVVGVQSQTQKNHPTSQQKESCGVNQAARERRVEKDSSFVEGYFTCGHGSDSFKKQQEVFRFTGDSV